MNRLRGLFLFSRLSSRGPLSLLLEPFAVGLLIAFMPVESQRFAVRAGREKLRVCYLREAPYDFRLSGKLLRVARKKVKPTGCRTRIRKDALLGRKQITQHGKSPRSRELHDLAWQFPTRLVGRDQ